MRQKWRLQLKCGLRVAMCILHVILNCLFLFVLGHDRAVKLGPYHLTGNSFRGQVLPRVLVDLRTRGLSEIGHTPSDHQFSWRTYGYGSIPMKIPFLVGWTSINPSYFDVNYRGTRFWHTAIWEHHEKPWILGFPTLRQTYRVISTRSYGHHNYIYFAKYR